MPTPASRRADADLLAWFAVHGLAMLVLDGPLRPRPRRGAAPRGPLLDMVDTGLPVEPFRVNT